MSLVVAPIVAEKDDKPLFADSSISNFEVVNTKTENGVVVLNYLKKGERASNNSVVIKWEDALTIDEAIESEKSDSTGLYYISRVFGNKETTLYLGIATKHNTIRHRLKGHKVWLKEYRGTIKVRMGKVIYDDLLKSATIESLNEACYLYIKYQFDNNLLVIPHQWLIEAYEDLKKA